jgi:DNA-binding response OmpR family regulator
MNIFDKLFGNKVKRVLLVEDDVPLRKFIADRLLENGYDVIETGDGEGAVGLMVEHSPNVVVLDVMLPGKNGMQILAEFRELDKQTPVIMLTTLSGEGGLRLKATKLNAVFLNKADTSLEVVIDTIVRHAEQKVTK